MNLYLLFAIALGAIFGTAEPAVARSRYVNVAAECGAMSSEQSVASSRSTLHHAPSESTVPSIVDNAPSRIEAPLTGAATPRAPAANC